MTRAYSFALKQQVVARLTGVNAVSAAQLARETGIRQQNLSRWLCEARNRPFGTQDNDSIPAWSVEQKARIIAQAAALAGDELSRYLEGEGVRFAHFKRWRLALEEAGDESVGMAKRIGKLERELARKERALAEASHAFGAARNDRKTSPKKRGWYRRTGRGSGGVKQNRSPLRAAKNK
jgi:transposase-like protein